eukprot:352987-Chlamydomonas_euryale.AAC.3
MEGRRSNYSSLIAAAPWLSVSVSQMHPVVTPMCAHSTVRVQGMKAMMKNVRDTASTAATESRIRTAANIRKLNLHIVFLHMQPEGLGHNHHKSPCIDTWQVTTTSLIHKIPTSPKHYDVDECKGKALRKVSEDCIR